MQDIKSIDMANRMIDQLIEKFDSKMDDFVITNVDEDVNHKAFNIDFTAYNYFICLISYERGRFGCSIRNGEYYISLNNSQKWYDEANFDIFFKELKEELELRIPDKYLEAKGWK